MVRLVKVNQVLDLIVWKVSREHTSQGEVTPDLIWYKTSPLNLILPKLIWEQTPKQIQNLFHHLSRKDWKTCLWIHLFHDLGSTRVRTPLDQIMSDNNTRVQTRSKLKNFCAS